MFSTFRALNRIVQSKRRNSTTPSNARRLLTIEELQVRQVFATLVVDTLLDGPLVQLVGDGRISLREAIEAANTNQSVDGSVSGQSSVVDIISFSPTLTGTIKLSAGILSLKQGVIVNGPGADRLAIDGDAKSGVFQVDIGATNSAMRDFAIVNGRISNTLRGGAGIANDSTLTLERISISNCVAGLYGGAIYNGGTLLILNSTIANNLAVYGGGGIQNDGILTIRNSTIVGNAAQEPVNNDTETKVAIKTQISGATNNRVEVQDPSNTSSEKSTVFYQGTDVREFNVPSGVSSIDILSTTMGITIGTNQRQESFAAEAKVDVTVTDVSTGDSGVIVIDDDVVGFTQISDNSDSVFYNLNLFRNVSNIPVFISGREYSLEFSDTQLTGSRVVSETDSRSSFATLVVSEKKPSNGGGINNRGTLIVSSSTIADNRASGAGGGIYSSESNFTASEELHHTILAGNLASSNLASDFDGVRALRSGSAFNILGDGSGSGLTDAQIGNQLGVDWKIVFENDGIKPLLRFNGGTTKTIGLIPSSPAIDRGSTAFNSNSTPIDQRGFARVVDGDRNGTSIVDIGAIEYVQLKFDFGDAPTAIQSGFVRSYPVTLAQDGARHFRSSLTLGTMIDDESDGFPSSNAGVDRLGGDDGTGIDDEEGITPASTVLSGPNVNVASVSVVASASSKLDAWIDFNRDGDWDDVGEQIFIGTSVQSGVNFLGFNVPSGINAGTVYSRFRLSTVGNLTPTGVATDGEVEDLPLNVSSGLIPAIALLELPNAQNVEIRGGSGDIQVLQNGATVFRSAISDATSFRLDGSQSDDTFLLGSIDLGSLSSLSLSGRSGFDVLRLTGAGTSLDLTARPTAIVDIEKLDVRGSGPNTLRLNLNAVQLLAPTTELQIQHDQLDTVSYGSGWTVQRPKFNGSNFVHLLKQGSNTIAIENTRPYQNPYNALDVDFSGQINPLDVLSIINFINSNKVGPLNQPSNSGELLSFLYIDSIGDGSVDPLDALAVINFLNRLSGGGGEGEMNGPNAIWNPIDLNFEHASMPMHPLRTTLLWDDLISESEIRSSLDAFELNSFGLEVESMTTFFGAQRKQSKNAGKAQSRTDHSPVDLFFCLYEQAIKAEDVIIEDRDELGVRAKTVFKRLT